jgi:hypothetical protein
MECFNDAMRLRSASVWFGVIAFWALFLLISLDGRFWHLPS